VFFVIVILAANVAFLGPQITSLLQTMVDENIPSATQFAMGLLPVLSMFLMGCVITIFLLLPLLSRQKWRLFAAKLLLKIPQLGSLVTSIIFWQFSKILHISLDAKLSFLQSLDLAIDTIKLQIIKNELIKVRENIECGYSIPEAFLHTKFTPNSVITAIGVGSESNNLSSVFKHLSEKQYFEILLKINFFGERLSDGLKIFAGLILITIVCGFLLPIYSYIEVAGV